MIISGKFNIYPSDLEEAPMAQPGVADAAVIGVASRQWDILASLRGENGKRINVNNVIALFATSSMIKF